MSGMTEDLTHKALLEMRGWAIECRVPHRRFGSNDAEAFVHVTPGDVKSAFNDVRALYDPRPDHPVRVSCGDLVWEGAWRRLHRWLYCAWNETDESHRVTDAEVQRRADDDRDVLGAVFHGELQRRIIPLPDKEVPTISRGRSALAPSLTSSTGALCASSVAYRSGTGCLAGTCSMETTHDLQT